MFEIRISSKYGNLVALLDDEDFEQANQWHWHAAQSGRNFYARSARQVAGVRQRVSLHGLITGWPYVDHINHNGLDNRRENLRPATHRQNMQNVRKNLTHAGIRTVSRFKGVTMCQGKWQAQISVNGRNYYLGRFLDEEDAARAYDQAALHHFGKFAAINFPAEVNP